MSAMGSDVSSKPKKVFISYLEDNGTTVNGYVDLIAISEGIVTIGTDKNVLRLPLSRVLKIKENREGNQ